MYFRFRAEEARDEKAAGEEHKEDARPVRDVQLLFAVDGDIVAHHAPAEAEEADVDRQQPRPPQEEMVKAELRLAGNLLALRKLHRSRTQVSRQGDDQREPEK